MMAQVSKYGTCVWKDRQLGQIFMTADDRVLDNPSRSDADGDLPSGWALKAFQQGLEAANAGTPVTTNPYSPDSNQAAMWEGGWQNGDTERQSAASIRKEQEG